MAALLAAAVACDHHSGGVQISAWEKAHLRGAHSYVGPILYGRHQRCYPVRVCYGVVVQGRQEFRAGLVKCLIDGASETCVFGVLDHFGPRSGCFAAADQLLPAVIDNDHVEVAAGLRLEGAYAIDKSIVCRQSRNDDGNAGRKQF